MSECLEHHASVSCEFGIDVFQNQDIMIHYSEKEPNSMPQQHLHEHLQVSCGEDSELFNANLPVKGFILHSNPNSINQDVRAAPGQNKGDEKSIRAATKSRKKRNAQQTPRKGKRKCEGTKASQKSHELYSAIWDRIPAKNLKGISEAVHKLILYKNRVTYETLFSDICRELEPEESKKIRRRLYDAVNVLEATGILRLKKEKEQKINQETQQSSQIMCKKILIEDSHRVKLEKKDMSRVLFLREKVGFKKNQVEAIKRIRDQQMHVLTNLRDLISQNKKRRAITPGEQIRFPFALIPVPTHCPLSWERNQDSAVIKFQNSWAVNKLQADVSSLKYLNSYDEEQIRQILAAKFKRRRKAVQPIKQLN